MSEVKVKKPEINNPGVSLRRPEPFFPSFPFGGALFGASPFSLMRRITDEMDRACSKFLPAKEEPYLWAPALEVTEKNGDFIATLELPGLKKEEVKVEVTDEAILVTGERKLEKEEKEEGYFRSERTYGEFYRTIPLPKDAKIDRIKAELNHGVLRISVPVPPTKTNVKTVEIK